MTRPLRFRRNVAACFAAAAIAIAVAPIAESAWVACAWIGFVVPGAWLAACWFDDDHPLGSAFAAPAVCTALAFIPFAIASACAVHAELGLSTIAVLHGVLCIALASASSRWTASRSLPQSPGDRVHGGTSRRNSLLVLAGLAAFAAGLLWLARIKSTPAFLAFRGRWLGGVELGDVPSTWWWGVPLALAGAVVAARAHAMDRRSRNDALATGLAWLACLVCVAWAARIAFTLPPDGFSARAPYDLDDVTYVAEAVDAAAGLPWGRYEPTLGAELGRVRSAVSVAWAPFVAIISLVTDVEPAALHHSVLPPLLVVLFASALLALVATVFPKRPIAAPLGVAAFVFVMCATWDYPANLGQYLVLQAAQPKSVHLGLLHPLQIALVVRVGLAGRRTDLVVAMGVALAAHCIHPFATIVGAIWTSAAMAVVVCRGELQRCRVLALLLLCHVMLGAEVWLASRHVDLPLELTDRTEGEIRESRDLLRDASGRPTSILDPRLVFGADFVTAWALLAVPLAWAARRRARELAFVTAFAVAMVAASFVPGISDLVGIALHPSIMWRARWLVPAAPLLALTMVVAHDGVVQLLPLRRARSVVALLLVLAATVTMTKAARGRWLRPGRAPEELTKTTPASLAVADALGRECDAFLWATGSLAHELPQLLPRIQLAMTRSKAMRPPRGGGRKDVHEVWAAFTARRWQLPDLRRLQDLYPVDLIALHHDDHDGREVLERDGWRPRVHTHDVDLWLAPGAEAHVTRCAFRRVGEEP